MKDNLHEQLVAARQGHILEAAAAVFAEKGFHATTIKDVARAAGVADGTIYNYFENKTALLLGLFDRMTEAARRDVDPAAVAQLDLRGFVRAALVHPLAALGANNFELFRVVVSEVLVNRELGERFFQGVIAPMLGAAEGYFGRWAERHGLPADRAEVITRAVSGLVLGLIVQRVMGDERVAERWDALPDELADLLVDGLGGATT